MPNRLIREGFLDSESINSLGDAAECFFHRLMLAADDAGRMDGRVEILRARLFPLDISRRASDVEKTLAACVKQGLVIPYEWKGQRFLQVSKWQRCSPCVTSKYPWRDGSFRIDYRKVETRDGEKDFVVTSIAIGIPCLRDTDGIGAVIPPMYGDVDVDVDEQEQGASPAAPSAAGPNAKNGTRLPDEWTLPPDWAEWARQKRPDLDIAEQGEKFADHWRAIPGAKGRKTDWLGTWRNWIRNERAGKSGAAVAPTVPAGKPKGPSETPLERAINYARQQFHFGAIDAAERDRLIAEATAKHREAK